MTDASARGERAALARRSRLGRALRRLRYLAIRVLLLVHDRILGASETDGFEYSPPPASPQALADLRARAVWYLAPTGRPVALPDGDAHAASAPYLDPALLDGVPSDRLVSKPHVLLYEHSLTSILRTLRRRSPITYVDPDGFNASDIGGYARVLRCYLGESPRPGRTFAEFRSSLGDGGREAFVLCTGPSATSVDLRAVTADIRIVCNSAVRDETILRELSPNVITFADPVFHFGPSRYAARFRADMLRAVERTGAWVLVPEVLGRFLLHHYPELEERTVLLDHGADEWTWPGRDGTDSIRPTANILTLSMLPVALALADDVVVAGCDGREPGDRYFWRHSTRVQYPDELMRSVWAAHPSFFRDRNYADYYGQHCRELEELISLAESAGKTVRSMTPSHIPALSERSVSPGGI